MREMRTRYPSELLGEVEKLPRETYEKLMGRLRKSIRKVVKRIAEAEGSRDRDLLVHYKRSLELLREAVSIRRSYFLRYKGKERLPLPVRDEEIEEFVKKASRDEVWSRMMNLQAKRERAKNEMDRYDKKSLKDQQLQSRYLYLLYRRELSLLYFYILREGKR